MFSEALTPSPPEWFESQHDGQKDAEGGQSSSLSVDDDGLVLHPRVCYFIGPGVSVCYGKETVNKLLDMLQSGEVFNLCCLPMHPLQDTDMAKGDDNQKEHLQAAFSKLIRECYYIIHS